MLTAKEV